MSLEPGLYIISCRGAGGYIGKNIVEDKSLLPKRIVNVPPDAGAPRFTVERSPSSTGCYVIRTTGALIAERNQLLWAYVLDSFAPSTYLWCINAEPQHGEHAYTVKKPGGGAGWCISCSSTKTQVAVEPLRSSSSECSPNTLFQFIRVDCAQQTDDNDYPDTIMSAQ